MANDHLSFSMVMLTMTYYGYVLNMHVLVHYLGRVKKIKKLAVDGNQSHHIFNNFMNTIYMADLMP